MLEYANGVNGNGHKNGHKNGSKRRPPLPRRKSLS
jgi:hypothetical protein